MFKKIISPFRSDTKGYEALSLKKQEKKQKIIFEILLKKLSKTNKLLNQYIEFINNYSQKLDEESAVSFLTTQRQAYQYANDKIIRNYAKLFEEVKKLNQKKDFSLEDLSTEKKELLLSSFDDFFKLYKKKETLEIKKMDQGVLSKIKSFLYPEEFDELKLFAANLQVEQNFSKSNQTSTTSLESLKNYSIKKSPKTNRNLKKPL